MTSPTGPELSVIVPTFNERENIEELVRRLEHALTGIAWEVIFVDDDSPDETAEFVRSISLSNPRVRVLHRIGRRGLATACVEGMLASSAPYLAVMDADLQHDERILPQMLATLKTDRLDVAVGSRYVSGGGTDGWQSHREKMSRFATNLSKLVLKADLRDPMSGFFMLRRGVIHEAAKNLSGIGFKILLDIFASIKRPLAFREIPYTFRARHAGESKLDSTAVWEYLMMLLDKMIGRYVPVRFIPFALIGGAGVFVHMLVLWVLFRDLHFEFARRSVGGRLVAMTFNFFLNNMSLIETGGSAAGRFCAGGSRSRDLPLAGRGRQCRHRDLSVQKRDPWQRRLGALRHRRYSSGRRVELRDYVRLHMEQAEAGVMECLNAVDNARTSPGVMFWKPRRSWLLHLRKP